MWPFSRTRPPAEHESCSKKLEALGERVETLEGAALAREVQLSELLDKVSWRLRERSKKRLQQSEPEAPAPADEEPALPTPGVPALPFPRSRRMF
jgi:hypothetical protein